MPTDVIPAETVAATPAAQPVTDYQKAMETWTPEERTQFALNGTEPKPKETPAQAEPPKPAKAESEPANSGEEDQDHEPEYFGTPEQIKAQRHTFMRIRRERTEYKTKFELLERQLAEQNKTAPAAEPQKEAPKSEAKTERPKRPRITDPKYANDDGTLYDADMDAYEEAREAARLAEVRESLKAEKAEESRTLTRQQTQERWTKEEAQLTDDERKIAFSPKVAASDVMLGVLTSIEGGPRVFLALGKDLEAAKALAEATHIPGYENYQQIVEAAEKNPAVARALGAAEALVQAEAKRLLSGSSKKDPQPITRTQAPAPGARVSAAAAASGDPIEDAYARGDYGEGARLEAARDAERKTRR